MLCIGKTPETLIFASRRKNHEFAGPARMLSATRVAPLELVEKRCLEGTQRSPLSGIRARAKWGFDMAGFAI
jgi:hypothetical protein